ncbi:MAG: hypothetical protein WBW04_01635 [Nitrolancea sp.]
MNLAAAFFAAGVWMIASALWQIFYRTPRIEPDGRVLMRLGIDVVPGALLAMVVAFLA